MNTTIEERKQKALEIMQKLDIYKPYIRGFKESNDVCYFERFAGFWAWQDEELSQKIKEIEEKNNCTVYAVTHEVVDFGDCYSLLIITDYDEEWNDLVTEFDKNKFYAFAYVWNKDAPELSEFGDILIQSAFGGIRRIA